MPANAINAPTIIAATPPIISHMDLSVGLPVKNRETSELNEWDSLKPKISNTIPTANRTNAPILFMPYSRSAGPDVRLGVSRNADVSYSIEEIYVENCDACSKSVRPYFSREILVGQNRFPPFPSPTPERVQPVSFLIIFCLFLLYN